MTTIAERLRTGMELRNLKQADIIERTGINKGALSSYLSGKYEPKQKNILLLAKALDINENWLMGYDVPMERMYSAFHSPSDDDCDAAARSHGQSGLGISNGNIEKLMDTGNVIEKLAEAGELFEFRIKGNSMEPKISDGDTLIVRKQDDANSGDIVIALINGSETTCKRLIKFQEGISLVSFNADYEPGFYSNKDIAEKQVRVIGRVIESRKRW